MVVKIHDCFHIPLRPLIHMLNIEFLFFTLSNVMLMEILKQIDFAEFCPLDMTFT